jgi:aminoglycoside phosphotransferase (APT) family kinase protein
MKAIYDPVDILQKEIQTWDSPFVELDCFGTDRAEQIAEMINHFCRGRLGSKLHGYLFYGSSVGSTHGVQLEDGRQVVIKVRPPPDTNPYLNSDRTSLESISQVMRWLSDRGYPCPKPILGPTSLAKGLATVDEFLDRGQHGNGFEPECRRSIASGFAELIKVLQSFNGEVSCLKYFQRSESLYPQPHSKLFDFKKTAASAEWIDDFARRARRAEAHEDKPVLAHGDWRVQHLGFQEGKIVATYDWDSLAFCTETELVGVSAHGFTADWTLEGVRRIPTANDIRAYVADYEHARGQPFSDLERKSLFAHCVYCIAYSARCEHSLEPDKITWEEDTWPYLLKTEGEALLREAQSKLCQ